MIDFLVLIKCSDIALSLLICIDFGVYMSFLRILYLYWLFRRGLRLCGSTFSYIPQALLPWAVSLPRQRISIMWTPRCQNRRTSHGAYLGPRLAWLLPLVPCRWLRRPAALLSALEVVLLQNQVLRLGVHAAWWNNFTVGFCALWMFSRQCFGRRRSSVRMSYLPQNALHRPANGL